MYQILINVEKGRCPVDMLSEDEIKEACKKYPMLQNAIMYRELYYNLIGQLRESLEEEFYERDSEN